MLKAPQTPSRSSIPRLARGVIALLFAAMAVSGLAAPLAQAEPATYAGASADGSRVFFTTKDKLVPGDTDRGFADVYERSYDPEPGIETYVTRELSTGPIGGNDAYPSIYQGASADGGEVFFTTQEPLVGADRDRLLDIYMRDTASGVTTLISAAGTCPEDLPPGACLPSFAGVSSDGSRVFFTTGERLSAEDTDTASDLYVWDEGAISLVSTSPTAAGNGETPATFVGASANGGRIFFETAESLVPADTNSTSDIYMRDLEAEPSITTLVTAGGTCPEGASASECLPKFRGVSADGSRAFFTTSEQLSGEDTDSASDLYVWEEGTTSLVSTGPIASDEDEKPATFAGSRGNGGLVFFQTRESLTAADTDAGAEDVYLRDLEAEPPTTTLVSAVDPSCEPSSCGAGALAATFAGASSDGQTVFIQTAEKLSSEDRDTRSDVYVRDLGAGTTSLVSRPGSGCEEEACGPPAASVFAGASADGSLALFTTDESLVPEDSDSEDVYGRNADTATTTRESPAGLCPLPGETGCDASFAGVSEDGEHIFFTTTRRLTASDVDSEVDIYEREGAVTRLVSTGNSVLLGPATPVLTGLVPGPTGETLTPSVKGHAPAQSAIKIYATPDCSGEPVVGTVEQLEGAGIQIKVPAGTTSAVTATATDGTGTTSDCSNVLDYTQQTVTPPSEEGGGSGTGGGGSESGGGAGSGSRGGGGRPRPGGRGGSGSASGGIAYVPPVTRITFGPAYKTRARRPVFRFVDTTGQPGTNFICRLDRRRWKSCTSPLRLRHLGPGRHVFRVKAENAIGEWEQRPTKRVFKLVGRRGGHGGGHR